MLALFLACLLGFFIVSLKLFLDSMFGEYWAANLMMIIILLGFFIFINWSISLPEPTLEIDRESSKRQALNQSFINCRIDVERYKAMYGNTSGTFQGAALRSLRNKHGSNADIFL